MGRAKITLIKPADVPVFQSDAEEAEFWLTHRIDPKYTKAMTIAQAMRGVKKSGVVLNPQGGRSRKRKTA